MQIDWQMFWNALSSIATIAAVITAFGIVKYEHRINNCKKIKIEFKHMTGQITYDGFRDGREVDSILIKFVNTGNRKVIIDGIKFLFLNGHSFGYTYLLAESDHDMTLPCALEIEESKQLVIPYSHFVGFARRAKELNHANEEIVIVATDTTDQEFRYKTGITYKVYLDRESVNA